MPAHNCLILREQVSDGAQQAPVYRTDLMRRHEACTGLVRSLYAARICLHFGRVRTLNVPLN
jgi:hypothetical protein